ncbi:MAG: SDR family oxidoreductase [Desulfurococcales archaeon]|nr:SDR family oxidoreductase [Desulfurococcales archaeon]
MREGFVLVTGGDRGIGRAVVLKFASQGYYVIFSYYRRADEADRTLKLLKESGGDGFYVRMDVTSEESVKECYEVVRKRIPYLNVLVNNAGVVSFKSIEETTLDEWRWVIDVNLTGAFLVTKYFLPLLKQAPWASIVNISSIAGQTGNVLASSIYCAAKAGVIGLTRRLAVELAPKVRVNAVAPSVIETDMARELINAPEKRKKVAELHPLKDIGKPEDVAELVFFLATPASRFITGQVIGVNGGRLTC